MQKSKKEVKNFGELTEFLSEKFDKIDKNFGGVNKKLDVLKNDMDFLIDTTKRGFDEVDEKFKYLDTKLSNKIDNVGQGLDTLVDILEDNRAINIKDVKKVRFATEVGK